MNISCSECRPQLGEVLNGEITGDTGATEEARGHLAECAPCRRDLALMRAGRDEMRSFPDIASAPDLRQSIRAQIAQAASTPVAAKTAAPIVAAVAAAKTDIAAPSKALFRNPNYQDNPRRFRTNKDRFVHFLQRPSNIAWASGLSLSAFCLILATRPEHQLLVSQSPQSSPQSQEYYGEEYRDSDKNAATQSIPSKNNHSRAATKNIPKTPMRQPALPRQPRAPIFPPRSGATGVFADDAANGTVNGGEVPLPDNLPAVAPTRQSKKFTAPGEKTDSNAAATSRTTISGNAKPVENNVVANGSVANNSAAANSALSQVPATSETERLKSENNGLRDVPPAPAPAMRSQVREQPETFSMRAPVESASGAAGIMSDSAGSASKSADSDGYSAQENRPTAKSVKPRLSTPVPRQVVARISAPRDVNWGQVSVVLPEGVRFPDGSRARVVWRGAIGAGEKIEIPISIEAASGAHTIRVFLQEVVNGDAQTIARDSVSVSGR